MDSRTILEAMKSKQIDFTDLYSSYSSCGEIHSDFVFKGAYAFNFTFGAAQLYIYYSSRFKKFYLYSRSYRPVHSSIFRVLAVSDERGFLIYETDSFNDCVKAFSVCVNQLLKDIYSSSFVPDDTKVQQNNLFQDYITSVHSEDFNFELSV